MKYSIHEKKGIKIVEVTNINNKIKSAQDFLDIIANVPSAIILLNKDMIDESFLILDQAWQVKYCRKQAIILLN